MLSIAFKNRFALGSIRAVGTISASRFFATKTDSDQSTASKDAKKESEGANSKQPSEKTSIKKDTELPDFPEFPFIRSDFESGIRNRDYLKTVHREKRADLLSKQPGDIITFDDEEFKYYFPHELSL